jgi:hypothetical protein
MAQGIIIDNGLEDRSLLENIKIVKTWQDGERTLHAVEAGQQQIPDLARSLDEGPWYMYFWEPDGDDVIVVFRERTFRGRHSDPHSLNAAREYGMSLEIPEEQLDFKTGWPE